MLTHDPDRNIGVMSAVLMEPADAADLVEAHALVERLIGPPTAALAVLQAMHASSGAAVYVYRENGRVSGVVGELPLTGEGLAALETGTFDALDPDPEHIARPGQIVAALYCWGCAGDTRRGAAAGVRAVVHARREIYRAVPFFTRAGKPAGAGEDESSKGGHAAIRRFACVEYPGRPGLLFSPAVARPGNAAA